jgi:hypothetical protein
MMIIIYLSCSLGYERDNEVKTELNGIQQLSGTYIIYYYAN